MRTAMSPNCMDFCRSGYAHSPSFAVRSRAVRPDIGVSAFAIACRCRIRFLLWRGVEPRTRSDQADNSWISQLVYPIPSQSKQEGKESNLNLQFWRLPRYHYATNLCRSGRTRTYINALMVKEHFPHQKHDPLCYASVRRLSRRVSQDTVDFHPSHIWKHIAQNDVVIPSPEEFFHPLSFQLQKAVSQAYRHALDSA